jgi:hypothetical protein
MWVHISVSIPPKANWTLFIVNKPLAHIKAFSMMYVYYYDAHSGIMKHVRPGLIWHVLLRLSY